MFSTILKRFVAVVFISVCALFVKAQQVHFIYLQTEGGQPFYVKLNNKVMSSSQMGYLILPKLSDGDYNLKIGFPKNEFPEENFQISTDKKNQGFFLKNFGEKGWGLFNMQSYNVVMGGSISSPEISKKKLQDDPFSKMLANVVKDSSILQKNEPEKDIQVTAKVDSSAKADSSVVVKAEPSLLSPATRLLSKKNNDGMEMIYVDRNNNISDTIRIFIPVEKSIETKASENNIVQIEKPVADSTKDFFKDSASKIDMNPGIGTSSDSTSMISKVTPPGNNVVEKKDTALVKNKEDEASKIESADSLKTQKKVADNSQDDIVVLPKVVKSSVINSDCKGFADDQDFLKLRKKMASENSNDNMIKAAKKVFHSKCFSTEQIKNLSFLFLTDEGKYIFFDAAYAYVSDSDQYSSLQSQLTDSYYVNRFKAMIHK